MKIEIKIENLKEISLSCDYRNKDEGFWFLTFENDKGCYAYLKVEKENLGKFLKTIAYEEFKEEKND